MLSTTHERHVWLGLRTDPRTEYKLCTTICSFSMFTSTSRTRPRFSVPPNRTSHSSVHPSALAIHLVALVNRCDIHFSRKRPFITLYTVLHSQECWCLTARLPSSRTNHPVEIESENASSPTCCRMRSPEQQPIGCGCEEIFASSSLQQCELVLLYKQASCWLGDGQAEERYVKSDDALLHRTMDERH